MLVVVGAVAPFVLHVVARARGLGGVGGAVGVEQGGQHLLVGQEPVAVLVVEVFEPSWRNTRSGLMGFLRMRVG